jgi:acetylornithine deacetylase/succinyl-diaminopimelate desuccinylase-like protein
LVPDQEPDEIFTLLTRHLIRQGFEDLEVAKVLTTAASRTPIDHPALEKISAVLQQVYGMEPIVFPSIGASGPNFVFTNILRQPCFLIPFADVDQCNHGPNENFSLDGFLHGIRTAIGLFGALARSG